jgi:RNAse (barnase) inhibitor barstar
MNLTVTVDCAKIIDWSTFHEVFAAAFGFPAFYGKNADAWIDCMSRLDDDFSEVQVEKGEMVTLVLANADQLKQVAPDILTAVLEMAGFVNFRRIETGDNPILIVSCNS